MSYTFGSLTFDVDEASSSSEWNAAGIIDMAGGAAAVFAAVDTPTRVEFGWEDPTAWRWLRSRLKPAEYAELVDRVWSHGSAEATPSRWKKITQGAA